MRFKYAVYSLVPFSFGGSSLFFLNSENLNSLISKLSISGGGNAPSFNFYSYSKNELTINNTSIPTTQLELNEKNFQTESLRVDVSESSDLNLPNLNEEEKTGSLKTKVNKIVTEVNKEIGVKKVEKEQEEQLSQVKKELQGHSGNLNKILSSVVLLSNSESSSEVKSRARRDSNSQFVEFPNSLDRNVRNSLGTYYKKFLDLKEKKNKFEKRLKNIEEKSEDIVVTQNSSNKYIDDRVLKSLEQIGWNTNQEIKFEQLINRDFWDGGENPYSALLDYESWQKIVDDYKKATKEIKTLRENPGNRTCAVFAILFNMSDRCFGNLKDLEKQKELLKKVAPFAVANKLFLEMGLVDNSNIVVKRLEK
ncbi:hypothetical protein [Mycoplasma parvum]|uniref:Uncharacterized protein n=1 Tax=Mycoplasma parvum str. Indiana TaxID=1403316 RepID=U5NFN0_9MOLU|nr:hypothetical protein [Mycoplasma parvum]AGX88964.1 hypothetical protein PRV_00995 [Mycoplasma parvum str. Indiana]